MGIDEIITLSVILIALILFITEIISVDVIAIGIMIILVLSGVITPEEGLDGFANEAVITVMTMFILSFAVIKSNVIDWIGPTITRMLKKGYATSIGGLSLLVGSMSAFVNNTPVVATFIPVISQSAKKANLPASRFLIPLSFVAMFGGMCTLIGTSTNMLVSGISSQNGLGDFSMFLFAPLGLIFMAVGVVYLMIFGKKLIREREDLTESGHQNQINNFLTEIRYSDLNSNKDFTISNLFKDSLKNLQILFVKRDNEEIESPDNEFVLKDGDVLLVRGDMERIKNILKNDYLHVVEAMAEKKFPDQETKLIELILQPNSDILRKKIKNIDFYKKYNANVLAIRQRGKTKFQNLGEVTLRSGDVLLIQTSEKGYQSFVQYQRQSGSPFLILKETELARLDKRKLLISVLTIAGVISLAVTGITPIAIAALAGVILLSATQVITMEDAYKAIDWRVIFLLAGALSLEKAMNKSGLSQDLGDFLIEYVGADFGPVVVISVLYFMTSVLTEIISNNAAAALLAPIGISIAQGMDINALPFLMAVAFAGSASFYTPIGYQTNTMVYSAGNYKFSDFTIIGAPLNIIFWIIATIFIPVFYPF
ncbi:MAG: SLC13 family permease [Crocinitomicaceae bacterium]|nr:SLC13 family permease [Crocinitomicaceae bacterium]